MEAFHRRYMVSNKILKLWVRMVRELDIAMIVPQHGAPLQGEAIGQLLDWLDSLACGIDLMGPVQYQVPSRIL
jgi:flavorubredoxin